MSNWYYADADQQRQGPFTAEEITRRFHRSLLRLDTLVWREGLAEWQPLRDFSEELLLQQAPTEVFHDAEAAPGGATAPSMSSGTPAASATRADDSPYAPPQAVLTSQQPVVTGADIVHAGFWKRLAASTIDGLLMTLVLLVVLALGGLMLGIGFKSLAQDMQQGVIGGAVILGIYGVPIVLQAVYFTWMTASSRQATLGKMAVGIKVVQGNGQPLAGGRSFGRWAGYFFLHLFTCGLTTLVSAFTVGLGMRKQALHDMVADTLVVDRWAFTEHPERQRRELGAVTVSMIVLLILLAVGYAAVMAYVVTMASRA